ncbi:Thiol-disulfide isomerase or thioredoxin [Singulisphaera sp. GP187]|uniref:thioredoxin-like domain-containing protein n=1 Tax=Singulisphaera sp. GP187 TaxID=1882752 RepID=UPI00092614EA|nr:thioredoxin-like domain-containing protein [Singulisphaera sp. GP187]SIO59484.1 Thiol-disulfide isomerase or thioredoxin [Singulisphaera sp. GP187]
MRQPKSMARWFLSLVLTSSLVLSIAAGLLKTRAEAGSPRTGKSASRTIPVERTSFLETPKLSLEGGVDWINSGPIRLEELRGKLVLLDFWTYCCINCHHVLPDLAKLEQKYKDELVVIGVHSPKFDEERQTENIRRKVAEYQIKHPVINDANQVLWNRFGADSWPTMVLIDVDGTPIGKVSGEGNYAILDHEIGLRVAKHKAKGDLNTTPLQFSAESDKPDTAPLLYPGKVLADEKTKQLFIADTAHNRIVLTDLDGRKAVVVGSGGIGLVDGDYAKAEFNRPQGLCLVENTLYVADTENHAIRAIDLKTKKVSTVAGTGQQGHRRSGAGAGKATSLSSPWDLVLIPGTKTLAIAMAGTHQIWRYDIPSDSVTIWAGEGRENIEDGPVHTALFSQPSGLATDGHNLFVADSEVSAIREIVLDKRKPVVRTIVGQGLFVFADVDGKGDVVRLQHCLGVAYGNGKLYIADTYNNKIKVCDPATRAVETLVGNKQSGESNDPPRFYQPGGLSVAGTNLYVADTNNGLIRVVDLGEKTVKTLEIAGLTPPTPPKRNPTFPKAKTATLEPTKVGPGKELTFEVTLPLEPGYKVSPDVAMPYLVETPEKIGILATAATGGQKLDPPAESFTIKVPLAGPTKAGDSFTVKLSVGSFVCSKDSSLCAVKNYVWTIPVTVATGAPDQIRIGGSTAEKSVKATD